MFQLTKSELQSLAIETGFQKNALEKFLQPLLTLTAVESDLIKAFYANGNLAIESLFPDEPIQRKVKMAPVLLWKIKNIQSLKNKRAAPE